MWNVFLLKYIFLLPGALIFLNFFTVFFIRNSQLELYTLGLVSESKKKEKENKDSHFLTQLFSPTSNYLLCHMWPRPWLINFLFLISFVRVPISSLNLSLYIYFLPRLPTCNLPSILASRRIFLKPYLFLSLFNDSRCLFVTYELKHLISILNIHSIIEYYRTGGPRILLSSITIW